ncbi:MAG: HD domain-containing phosphohydrolase [Solirubrobacteraceae bacterium]
MADETLPDPIAQLRILVVDDQSANVRLLERVLTAGGHLDVHGTTDPTTVAQLCRELEPALLLLDLHMPGMDGFDVMAGLRELLADGRGPTIVMLTADVTTAARRQALSLGARDFLVKPFDSVEVLARVHNLLENHYIRARLENQNALLAEQVALRTRELEDARREVLERLALAAEYRDYTTGAHTHRVGRTARLMAEELGLPSAMVDMMADAAPLHDIGKLAVPDSILLKPGPLDDAERTLMRTHVRAGAEILRGSRSPVLLVAREVVSYHHERWDGTGYIAELSGDTIPVSGRITALADTFDAMTHDRPYHQAVSVNQALTEIRCQSGQQFDPALVDAFMSLDHRTLL